MATPTSPPALVHPQRAIHAISLLSNNPSGPSTAGVHLPVSLTQDVPGVTKLGADAAQAFWMNAARDIDWFEEPAMAYGHVEGEIRPTWYPKGKLNSCYNAVDRHVLAGHGDRPALHYYCNMPAASAHATLTLTYSELLWEVQALAGVMRHRFNVKEGDRVVIYAAHGITPIVSLLACARIGAIAATVFAGFAANELAKRLEGAEPVLLIAGSCGIEPKGIIEYKPLVDGALALSSHKPPVLMHRRHGIKGHTVPKLSVKKNEYDFDTEMNIVKRSRKRSLLVEKCVSLDSSAPLYILYTSGTTALPKGVVRYNGGHAVTSRMAIEQTFGLSASRGDTMFSASDIGWVVAISYATWCPLFLGCASVIFEGKPILPDAGTFWKICEKYKVTCLMTAPTALRAIQRDDPDAKLMSKYNLKSLKSLVLAGERSEPSIVIKHQELLTKLAAPGAIVVDTYWSTETGSPCSSISAPKAFPPLAPRPGAAGLPLPGMDLRIVDDEGVEVATGVMGNIVLGQPLPPSALGTVWRSEERYHEAYFARFAGKGDWYDSGDAGVIDDAGYISVLSRADDLINVAGHRLGTSLIEQVVASHPFVAECCVVGLPDEIKGHLPFAVIVRASSKEAAEADLGELLRVVNLQVRKDVGAIATLGGLISARLPKTRSGKTLRRTIKTLVENASVGNFTAEAPFPPTIEDVTAVDDARLQINTYFQAGGAKAVKMAKL